jgi:hypothetical protein
MHAKKYALVDPKVLEALRNTPKPQDAVAAKMSDLDSEMRAALGRPGDIAHKVQVYNQILQRYLAHQENRDATPLEVQLKPPPSENAQPPVENTVEGDVMASLPKSYHAKGSYLLTRLRHDPHVDWTDRGELILDGKTIQGSNLADLLNDVLRNRKNAPNPVGWSEFADHLQRMNIPREFIGNKGGLRGRPRFFADPPEDFYDLYDRDSSPEGWSPKQPPAITRKRSVRRPPKTPPHHRPGIPKSRRRSKAPDKWSPGLF